MNIIGLILILVAIYALLYVYNSYIENFTNINIENDQIISSGNKIHSNELYSITDGLLLTDTYVAKNNVGYGFSNTLNSNSRYSFRNINNKTDKELNVGPDNGTCIPFEICNTFYGDKI